jgi:hypothetical protein
MDMDDDFVGTLEFDQSAQDAELVNRAISLAAQNPGWPHLCACHQGAGAGGLVILRHKRRPLNRHPQALGARLRAPSLEG